MASKKNQERAVLVTTGHRGVFFGYTTDDDGEVMRLSRARMAIYWGTTRGVMELAEAGPNTNSKISARADLHVRHIDMVAAVTPAAVERWELHP